MLTFIINGTNLLHMELNIASEILDILLGEEIHARALAKKLEINHMTVIRNLKELVSENVAVSQNRPHNLYCITSIIIFVMLHG